MLSFSINYAIFILRTFFFLPWFLISLSFFLYYFSVFFSFFRLTSSCFLPLLSLIFCFSSPSLSLSFCPSLKLHLSPCACFPYVRSVSFFLFSLYSHPLTVLPSSFLYIEGDGDRGGDGVYGTGCRKRERNKGKSWKESR